MDENEDTSPALVSLQRTLSAAMREQHIAPPADPFDPMVTPFGVLGGANKGGFTECAVCGKPPSVTQLGPNKLFLFRDQLSAREYQISGMCQSCQDAAFKEPEDGE